MDGVFVELWAYGMAQAQQRGARDVKYWSGEEIEGKGEKNGQRMKLEGEQTDGGGGGTIP